MNYETKAKIARFIAFTGAYIVATYFAIEWSIKWNSQ